MFLTIYHEYTKAVIVQFILCLSRFPEFGHIFLELNFLYKYIFKLP